MSTMKQKILLVDDDPYERQVIETFFRFSGHQVETANNGIEALHIMLVSGNDIGLVVTDVDMPLLGGPALAIRLGRKWPRLPIIFVSGRNRCAIATELPLEAVFLQKPFSLKMLARLVQDALSSILPGEAAQTPSSCSP